MNNKLIIAASLGLALWAPACQHGAPAWLSPVPDAEAVGVFHEVRPGESLVAICRAHGVDLQEVAELNGIEDADRVAQGQLVFLPDVDAATTVPTGGREPIADAVQRQPGRFVWPVDGVLTSRFGIRNGRRHDGIDIGAPEGSPVRASAAGKVLFEGEQRGYGKLVILRHEDDFITVYAHNRRNLVREGAKVEQGQRIAEVGQTGRATGPHVHFEIRKRTKPRNPLFFLPRPPERPDERRRR